MGLQTKLPSVVTLIQTVWHWITSGTRDCTGVSGLETLGWDRSPEINIGVNGTTYVHTYVHPQTQGAAEYVLLEKDNYENCSHSRTFPPHHHNPHSWPIILL